MARYHFQRPAFIMILTLIMLTSAPALALALNANQLQQEVQALVDSPDHIFAPKTIAKAQAYVGAALLDSQRNDKQQLAEDLQSAATALNEAKQIAANYKTQYHNLLVLRQNTKQAVDLVHDPDNPSDADTQFAQAENTLNTAIAANEAGDLNSASQDAQEAASLYEKALQATLPAIVKAAQRALDSARYSYASSLVPDLYGSAKQEVYDLKQYIDGITSAMPAQPAHALILARKARDVGAMIRKLRRRSDGYESLVLKASKQRKQVAVALGKDVDPDDIATDVPNAELVQLATALKDKLDQERQQNKENLSELKAQYAASLQQKLDEQKGQLLNAQNSQLTSLKDAFKAKLAQETFETKRQAKLRKLFKPGEVKVFINLDGSLLIRLKALKFASGQTTINKHKYSSLINRLKQALSLYNDRNYRIEGHTDNQGGIKSNQILSLKRAEAVRNMLVADGVAPSKIKTFGYGEVRPIASNAFAQGRAMNRRIDVIIEAAAQSK